LCAKFKVQPIPIRFSTQIAGSPGLLYIIPHFQNLSFRLLKSFIHLSFATILQNTDIQRSLQNLIIPNLKTMAIHSQSSFTQFNYNSMRFLLSILFTTFLISCNKSGYDNLSVKGLKEPVEIIRDEWGVNHI